MEKTIATDFSERVKSVSIDTLLNQRAAVLERIEQAIVWLKEAQQIAEGAHLSLPDFNINYHGTNRGFPINSVRSKKEDMINSVSNVIDAEAWGYLMNESGLRSLMDAKARNDWDEALYKGDCLPLTRENILAAFEQLYSARAEMFERGVFNVFRRLSENDKTHPPFKLGRRIIIDGLADIVNGNSRFTCFRYRSLETLDDLARVFHLLDGQPEPDHRHGMGACLRAAADARKREWSGPYFSVRWFKKGTGHLTFARPDLMDKVNLILAKHYPHAERLISNSHF